MSASISNALPQYHPSASLVFHPYAHDSSVPPPALSTRRVNRLNPLVQFPTFLYASEPPPPTARNKQRLRPTAAQLSELKALYAATAHPARDVREALGRKIGMRHQSVTNWFQNQRSTARRRGRTATAATHSQSQSPSRSRSTSRSSMGSPERNPTPSAHGEISSHASGDDDDVIPPQVRGRSLNREPFNNNFPCEQSMPRIRARIDPVKDIIDAQAAARQQQQQQLQQLQQLQRQQLPLPLSTVPSLITSEIMFGRELHSNITGPASLNIPPAALFPPAPHTSFSISSTSTPVSRSHTPPLLSSFQVSRPPSPEPLDDSIDEVPRGKRSRPTTHQLIALRALHAVTSSPSIEERTKLGREIGMELGKVTNWFRNLRQTARKKERSALEAVTKSLYQTKRLRDVSLPSSLSRTADQRESKRSKLAAPAATAEDEDDDNMSVSHANSGSFDTRSTVDSADHDMDYELDQPRHHHQQQQQPQDHRGVGGDSYDNKQGQHPRQQQQPQDHRGAGGDSYDNKQGQHPHQQQQPQDHRGVGGDSYDNKQGQHPHQRQQPQDHRGVGGDSYDNKQGQHSHHHHHTRYVPMMQPESFQGYQDGVFLFKPGERPDPERTTREQALPAQTQALPTQTQAQAHQGNKEHDQEEGSESDSTHEAVTPEPQHHRAGVAVVPSPLPPPPLPLASTSSTTTASTAPPAIDNENQELQQQQKMQSESSQQLPPQQSQPKQQATSHPKQPSLDDAMLLLEFHSARAS